MRLGDEERWISAGAGVVCTAIGIRKGSYLLGGVGLYLVARGAFGRSPWKLLYAAAQQRIAELKHAAAETQAVARPVPPPMDAVDEASWESFPASDPPSYIG